jgi:acetolactate synthase-1/3 small subunit
MRYIYIISIVGEDTLIALQRMIGIFVRQRITIKQMNISSSENKNISHCSIVVHTNEKMIEKLLKQLRRIIELFEVKITNQSPLG